MVGQVAATLWSRDLGLELAAAAFGPGGLSICKSKRAALDLQCNCVCVIRM